MPPNAPVTAQQTLEEIDAKAKAAPDRALFYVKVGRKSPNGLVYQQVAAFSDASITHLGDPARWLLQLGGGGEYSLRVSHADTVHQEIGGPLVFSLDQRPPNGTPMKEIDRSATFRDGWAGPPTMVMPNPVPPAAGFTAAARDFVLRGTQWSASPNDAEAIAQANAQAQAQAAAAAVPPALASEWARREKEFLEKEAQLKKDIAEKEAKIREESLLSKIEAKNREVDAKLSRLVELQSQPKQNDSSWIEKLITAVMPLVTQLLTSQHDMRMLMMKQGEQQTAQQLAAAERNHQQMMEFLKAATAPKQNGMSDEMKMLIDLVKSDKQSTSADAMAAMTMRMVDAMNMVTKSSISMMEAATDAFAPAEEHPAVAAIREGVKAIGMVSAGMREGMRKTIPQPTGAGQPPGVQLPPGYVAVPAAALQQAQARAQAAVAAAQRKAQQPPPVATVPDPVPAPAPPAPSTQVVDAVPQVVVPPAVAAPPAVAPTPHPEAMRPLPIDILANGIRQLAPIEEVAKYFVQLVKTKDASIYEALEAVGGDPDQVVIEKLGKEFVAANMEYLEALSDEIDRQGEAAGITENGGDDNVVADEAEPE